MKYRQLGRTNLKVSEIGLGCSGFWGDRFFDEGKAFEVVRSAYEGGVNFFDTGSNYSNFNAEPRLGRALRPILAGGHRNSLVISTKAGSTAGYAPTIPDNDMSHTDFSPAAIEESCLKSIENLGCDYIDVFQLHGLNHDDFGNELFDKLLSLRDRGLIRYIGINTHFESEMRMVLDHADIFDMILIDCNLLQLDRYSIIEEMAQQGIGVAIGTVLAQGHLVSKKIGAIRNGSFFWYLARTLLKPTTRDFRKNSSAMRAALATVSEMSAAQAAFVYMLRNDNIASCIFGTTSVDNLTDVLQAPNLQLSDESIARIENAAPKIAPLSR